ncbi:RraA family protein [Pseudaestuariivita sp.]|uniref:RraA family protein n=1 Tax=Pseudaestuariivita sp. TaxID=2211669 RepID=UPI0040587E3D
MIEKPPLLTMRTTWKRPTAAQLAAFKDVPTSMISDAMDGRGALDVAISPVLTDPSLPSHVVGAALPADNGPGAIIATLALLELAQPGDLAVVSVSGFQGASAFGDRVAGMLRNSGVVGMVTDGPVRDAVGIEGTGMPVWATGLVPNTPHDNGPGRAGLPMVMASQAIDAGDIIVADRDGVVVVPLAQADTVAARLEEVIALETALDAKVASGLTIPPDLVEFLASDAVRRV